MANGLYALGKLSQENNKTLKLSPLSNIHSARKTKDGMGVVEIGVDEETIMKILAGELVGGFIIADRSEFQRAENQIPREEAVKFAEAMEVELKENDYKGGWKDCKPEFLMAKLTEEVKELYEATKKMDENKYNYSITDEELQKLKKVVLSEAADVGNIAMMISDVWGAL